MKKVFLLFILWTILGVACTPYKHRDALQLNNASSILLDKIDNPEPEVSADSALSLLNHIDVSKLNHKDQLRFQILLTFALYKLDLPIDTTSFLKLPTQLSNIDNKYPDLYLRYKFLRAWYKCELKDYKSAMQDALETEKIALQLGNKYWEARIYDVMACILSNNANWEEAINYNKKVISLFQELGFERLAKFSKIDLAINLNGTEQFDKADNEFSSVILSLSTNSEHLDTPLYKYAISALACSLSDRREYIKADSLLNNVKQYGTPTCTGSQFYFIKSRAALERGDREIAKLFADSIDTRTEKEQGLARKLEAGIHIAKANGNYRRALELTVAEFELDQDYIAELLRQSAVATQRDFYDRQAREEEAQKKEAELRLWLAILGAVGVIAGGHAFYFYRMRVKERRLKENEQRLRETEQALRVKQEEKMRADEELKEKIDEVLKLQTDLEEAKELDIKKSNQIVDLYQERQSFFNKVVSVYFQKKDSPNIKKTILNDLDKMINDMKKEVKTPKLMDEINAVTGGLMDTLQEKCPSLSKDEVMIIAMLYAGYIPLFISDVCNFSPGYTYTKKSRILKKIEETLPDLPEELRKRL